MWKAVWLNKEDKSQELGTADTWQECSELDAVKAVDGGMVYYFPDKIPEGMSFSELFEEVQVANRGRVLRMTEDVRTSPVRPSAGCSGDCYCVRYAGGRCHCEFPYPNPGGDFEIWVPCGTRCDGFRIPD